MQKSTINGYRVGVLYRFLYPIANPWPLGTVSLFAELSPAVTFSRYKEKGQVAIANSLLSRSSAKGNVTQYSVMPAIGARLNVKPTISVSMEKVHSIMNRLQQSFYQIQTLTRLFRMVIEQQTKEEQQNGNPIGQESVSIWEFRIHSGNINYSIFVKAPQLIK